MPRPTSPREELLRTPTPPGQAAGNPRRGFPPARKGFVFVDIPRKLDVGTATIRYLVNLPHVRVRYGVQKKKKKKKCTKVCVPRNAPTRKVFLLLRLYVYTEYFGGL